MAYGLLQVASNADMEREEQAGRARAEAEANQERVENELVAHVRKAWDKANQAKNATETRMLRSKRQINGEYDPDQLDAIRQMGGSEIYMMLTATKARGAKSWIRDVLMPGGDSPWTIKPSQEAEIPPDLEREIQRKLMQDAGEFLAQSGQQPTPEMFREAKEAMRKHVREAINQEAHDKASRLEDRIEDLLTRGGWNVEFDKVISDLVDTGTGILKGPVMLKSRQLSWTQDAQGMTTAEAADEVMPHVQRVDPFDLYPLPGVTDVDEGDLIERHRFYRRNLYDMIGVPGYQEDAIREVLRKHTDNGLRDWLNWTLDTSRETASKQDTTNRFGDDLIDVLEYWGSVPGAILSRWGVEGIEDPEAEYEVNAWLVDTEIIKIALNPDPMGRKPYSRACYQYIADNFWGHGVPDLMRDAQQICNASARALVNNMGIASGPMAVVNMPSVPPGEDPTIMYPWRVFQMDYRQMGNSTRAPVEFFQPNPLVDALIGVYDRFQREADEQSGLPSYTQGSNSNSGGSASTASGLSMLMNAAAKGIKNVVSHVDDGIITPTIERTYAWVMQYDDDDSIKGDVDVIARGALSLVAKEQTQIRRQEFLHMTANPTDFEIMGVNGRAALLRELVKGLDMPDEDVIPDDEQLQAQQQAKQRQAQAQQQQAQPAGQPPQGAPQ